MRVTAASRGQAPHGNASLVLKKAKNNCNTWNQHPNVVFPVPHGVFHSIPNGILVLIRSKLSMKVQSVVEVVLEKAMESYRGYKGHTKVVFLSPSDCFSFYLEGLWLPPSDVALGFSLSP